MKLLKISSPLLIVLFMFNITLLGSNKSSHSAFTPLKKAGVCLTFDGQYFDSWIKALPLFDKYKVRVSFFVNGKLNHNQLEKIRKLQSHGYAIGSHGLKHLKAISYCRKHRVDKYFKDEIYPQLKIFKIFLILKKVINKAQALNSHSFDQLP